MRSFTAAVLFAVLTVKADIIAWSGNTCDGGEGANITCDGTCIAFDGRHSFEVVTGGSHCVVLFEDDGCLGETFRA
ncbi:hypothetical protein B0H12DRAFT_1036565 [Mycena haematopus]|nr:hypothetical protein B0H12DRAFT_1036565 [Mycena haematopus]